MADIELSGTDVVGNNWMGRRVVLERKTVAGR